MEKHYYRPIFFVGCKGPGQLPYLIVSGVWRNFQFLHICVTFDKFSALNPGWVNSTRLTTPKDHWIESIDNKAPVELIYYGCFFKKTISFK